MSYGYTCDWCGAFGKPVCRDQREGQQKPDGWAEIKHGEHVCGNCLSKGRNMNKPKTKQVRLCPHTNKQYYPSRGGAPTMVDCLDCGSRLFGLWKEMELMGSKLAETILHDIEDELTDHYTFLNWWWNELDDKERHLVRGRLVGIIDNNIEREASLAEQLNTELNILANESQES